MNIFLVGNGFDLYHDLPTKYENFLHTMQYIRNHKSDDFSQYPIGKIFESIASEKKDSFIEQSYTKYKTAYDEIYFEKKDLEKIKVLLDNRWLKYFIHSFNKDAGWIDFEKEIAFVLKNLYYFLLDSYASKTNAFVLNDFNFFFTLKDRQSPNFQASRNIEIADDYVDHSPNNFAYYKPNREKIADKMFEYLEELNILLKLYLKYFVEKLLDLLNKEDLSINNAFQFANYIVNFNYTNTFEKLYRNDDRNNCFYLHGVFDDKIVLGINPDAKDELNELDTTFIKFKKYYQRIIYRTDIGYQNFINKIRKNQILGKSFSSPPINVVVVGHSLDKTDEDIIKELFKTANRIIIAYHSDRAIGKYIKNLISIYGKSEFDELRSRTNLEFVSYEKLRNKLLHK